MPNPDGTLTPEEVAAQRRNTVGSDYIVPDSVVNPNVVTPPMRAPTPVATIGADVTTPAGTGPLSNEAVAPPPSNPNDYVVPIGQDRLPPVSTPPVQPSGPTSSIGHSEAETQTDSSGGYDGSPIPLAAPRTGTSSGPGTKGLKQAWSAENASTLDAAQNQVTRAQTSAQKLEAQATEFQKQADVAKTQAQKSQDAINQENQKWSKWAADWTTQTEASRKDLEQQKVDPDRFWNSKSTFSKIAIALSVAGEAIGSAWARTGGGNVLRTLDQHVNDDIDAQKAAIDNKRASFAARQNMFGQQMQLHGDRVAAEEATRGFAWDQVAKMATVQSQLQATQEKKDNYGAIADQAKMKATESFTGYQTRLYTLAKQQAAASAASRAKEQQFAEPVTNPDGSPVIGADGRPVFRMTTPTKMQERNDKLAAAGLKNENSPLSSHVDAQRLMKANPNISVGDPVLFQQALKTRSLTRPTLDKIDAANRSAENIKLLVETLEQYDNMSPWEKLGPKGRKLVRQYEAHGEEYAGVIGKVTGVSSDSSRKAALDLVPSIHNPYAREGLKGLWSPLAANIGANLGTLGITAATPKFMQDEEEGGAPSRINVRTQKGEHGTIPNTPEAKRMAEASGMTVLQ